MVRGELARKRRESEILVGSTFYTAYRLELRKIRTNGLIILLEPTSLGT